MRTVADREIARGRDKDSNGHGERWHLRGSSHPKEEVGMLAPGRALREHFLPPLPLRQAQHGHQVPLCYLGGLDQVSSRSCHSNTNAWRWQSWEVLEKITLPKDAKTLATRLSCCNSSHISLFPQLS